MGKTTATSELGEAMILADLQRQGHGVADPVPGSTDGLPLPLDIPPE
jgi:hypothetical protein